MLYTFLILQLLLSPLSRPQRRAPVMTLPIMVTITAIYGAKVEKPNRFGKNLSLSNLQAIGMADERRSGL